MFHLMQGPLFRYKTFRFIEFAEIASLNIAQEFYSYKNECIRTIMGALQRI